MKLYRVYGYRRFILPSFKQYIFDDAEYFETLDEALAYIHRFLDINKVWSVYLYDGFIPVKCVARSVYLGV